jgi:hypothetical protein
MHWTKCSLEHAPYILRTDRNSWRSRTRTVSQGCRRQGIPPVHGDIDRDSMGRPPVPGKDLRLQPAPSPARAERRAPAAPRPESWRPGGRRRLGHARTGSSTAASTAGWNCDALNGAAYPRLSPADRHLTMTTSRPNETAGTGVRHRPARPQPAPEPVHSAIRCGEVTRIRVKGPLHLPLRRPGAMESEDRDSFGGREPLAIRLGSEAGATSHEHRGCLGKDHRGP